MIVDTSAIVAILRAEDDAAIYAQAIATADVRRLSAASYLQCGIVLDSQRDPIISRSLDDLLQEADFVVQPVTERQARLARQAYADFGKGSGHRAGLTSSIACRSRSHSMFASHCCGRAPTSATRGSNPLCLLDT